MSEDAPADLCELACRIRAGTTSSRRVVRECLATADAIDPVLGTYLKRFDESSMAAAAAVDAAVARGEHVGLLAGVPLGVKDFIATREAVTTGQSAVYDAEWWRGRDASVVERLRAAGAIIIGKTSMAEHAAGRPDPALPFPIPRNPWDLRRWTGGSSTGTANGIAGGLFPAGLGTDTSGSVRIPAAMCGITGLKPTHGLMSMDGCLEASPSLDVIGPMAHSARDCAVMLDVMTEMPGDSARHCGTAGTRIGVPWALLEDRADDIDDACSAAFRRAVAELEAAGAHVVDFDLGEIDRMVAATMIIMMRQMHEVHRRDLDTRWNDFGRSIRRLAAAGGLVTDRDYDAALAFGASISATLRDRMAGLDAVATPTWTGGAPLYQSNGGVPPDHLNLAAAWSVTGFPALALPMGFDGNSMPVSLQLVGKPMAEHRLLDIGIAFQRRTDWHTRRPAIEKTAEPEAVADLDDGLDLSETAIIEQIGSALSAAAHTMKGARS